MKNKHEPVFNVIRTVSTVSIVLYHYSYTFYEYDISLRGPEFLLFSNGDYGSVFVTVFFMLSGGVLLYNYPSFYSKGNTDFRHTLKNIGMFYGKRWIALFPMFYICWSAMYVIRSIRSGNWFWGGPKRNFILSFLGMDGYFLPLGPNYYSIGEWFIGGIIFMYLFYPLLLFAWNRARIALSLFIIIAGYYNGHVVNGDNRSIWVCLMNFYLGFIFTAYVLPNIKRLKGFLRIFTFLIISLAASAIIFLRMPFNRQEAGSILAFLICALLAAITPAVTLNVAAYRIISSISRYSYGIFLVHHVMLYAVMKIVRGFVFTGTTSLLFFIPLFSIIMSVSAVITKVAQHLYMKSLVLKIKRSV